MRYFALYKNSSQDEDFDVMNEPDLVNLSNHYNEDREFGEDDLEDVEADLDLLILLEIFDKIEELYTPEEIAIPNDFKDKYCKTKKDVVEEYAQIDEQLDSDLRV